MTKLVPLLFAITLLLTGCNVADITTDNSNAVIISMSDNTAYKVTLLENNTWDVQHSGNLTTSENAVAPDDADAPDAPLDNTPDDYLPIPDPDDMILLSVRDYNGIEYIYGTVNISISQTALFLMDVWQSESFDDVTEGCILPLVELARANNMLIIHALHGRPVHPLIGIGGGELELTPDGSDVEWLHEYLHTKNIKNLLYVGYLSNMCVLNRPTGIPAMSRYNVIFVRDASVAGTMPGIESRTLHEITTTAIIELNWGCSTSVNGVLTAFGITPVPIPCADSDNVTAN